MEKPKEPIYPGLFDKGLYKKPIQLGLLNRNQQRSYVLGFNLRKMGICRKYSSDNGLWYTGKALEGVENMEAAKAKGTRKLEKMAKELLKVHREMDQAVPNGVNDIPMRIFVEETIKQSMDMVIVDYDLDFPYVYGFEANFRRKDFIDFYNKKKPSNAV